MEPDGEHWRCRWSPRSPRAPACGRGSRSSCESARARCPAGRIGAGCVRVSDRRAPGCHRHPGGCTTLRCPGGHRCAGPRVRTAVGRPVCAPSGSACAGGDAAGFDDGGDRPAWSARRRADQDTNLSASATRPAANWRDSDIDVAREIARAIFGSSEHLDLRVVDADQRESCCSQVLGGSRRRTYSITCERKAADRFLDGVPLRQPEDSRAEGSGIDSAAKLGGKRVCAVSGTTSPGEETRLDPKPVVLSASTWTDCLLMLQQGRSTPSAPTTPSSPGWFQQDPNVGIAPAAIGTGALRHRG